MKRFWLPGTNPSCDLPDCRHPLRGDRKVGHFNLGAGPCKAAGCTCTAFRQFAHSTPPGTPSSAVTLAFKAPMLQSAPPAR